MKDEPKRDEATEGTPEQLTVLDFIDWMFHATTPLPEPDEQMQPEIETYTDEADK